MVASFRARVAEEGTACPKKAARPPPWPQPARQELHDKYHLQHPTRLAGTPQEEDEEMEEIPAAKPETTQVDAVMTETTPTEVSVPAGPLDDVPMETEAKE